MKKNTYSKKMWTGRMRGGYWGNYIFLRLLKIGLLPAYALLLFVALYYVLFRINLLKSSRVYLEKILKRKISVPSLPIFKLALNFGVSMLDRAAFFGASKSVRIDSKASDTLIRRALKEKRGVIILTAHVGGWQIASASLASFGIPVSVIGEENEDEKIKRLISGNDKFTPPNIIPNSPESFFYAYSALKRGHLLAMHADRFISGRFLNANFLTSEARFPTFAYALARKTGARIIQVLCVRKSLFNYETSAFDITPKSGCRDFESEALRAYVGNLEFTLERYPYQWYNFFDFWAQ